MDTIETLEKLLEAAKQLKEKFDQSGTLGFEEYIKDMCNDCDFFKSLGNAGASLSFYLKRFESALENINDFLEDKKEDMDIEGKIKLLDKAIFDKAKELFPEAYEAEACMNAYLKMKIPNLKREREKRASEETL